MQGATRHPAPVADPWDRAWRKLEKEKPNLLKDYNAVAKAAGFEISRAPFREQVRVEECAEHQDSSCTRILTLFRP